jgi:parallel beta-helix repeat protein
MRTRHLLISFALGMALALALLWALGARSAPAALALSVAEEAAPVLSQTEGPHAAPAPSVSERSAAGGLAEASYAPAAELEVCAACTYTTVQAAVNAASAGDVIKVATGVYTGVQAREGVTQVVYVSKTVTIRGGYTIAFTEPPDPGVNPTTLDAEGQGRVLYITGDISPTIEGLRVTGGNADGLGGGSGGWDAGGGLYVVEATATISNNRVFSNTAYGGGGLYLHYSAATLNANTISGNAANGAHGGGGGLYLFDSDATLSGNTISSNTISDEGGGLYLFYSDATLSENIIISNTASDDGGGLYLHYSDATLSGNTVVSNTAGDQGGGLYLRKSNATLSGNTVVSNTASDDGGGLYLDYSDATLSGNTVIANTAYSGGGLYLWVSNTTLGGNTIIANSAEFGGGLFVRESGVTLDNNIVTDNRVANRGSGLYVAGSSLRLRHTTLARNTGGDGSGVYVTDYGPYDGAVALTNTILVSHTVGIVVTADNLATLEATLWGEGAWANTADWGGTGSIFTGTVNVYGDPAFAGDGASAEAYHLMDGSAAIDEGVDAGLDPDIDLDLRPVGAGFDIGADEFPVVVTVSQGISATLVYTDPQGNPTRLEIPAGAVTETITIVYTPKHPQVALPLPEGLVLGAHVFDLDAYRNDILIPHFVFERVVTLTSKYADADVADMIESTLALCRGPGIEDIGTRPGESQTRDTENNLLTAYLLGTSRFKEYGVGIPTHLFLPLVIRNG